MSTDNLGHAIHEMEDALRVPQGFMDALLKEDDWSFVVKLHALVEAGTAALLTECFGRPALAEVFTRLELSDKRKGKVVFARSCELIDASGYRFICKLSEIRNMIVHDVSNVSFKMGAYVRQLDKPRRSDFVGACAMLWDDSDSRIREFILANAQVIWLCGVYLLASMYHFIWVSRLYREVKRAG